MKIPESFKTAQKRTFQDKTVEHYRLSEMTQDSEGNDIDGAMNLIGTYLVNLRLLTDRVVAEEWGLEVEKDVSITYNDDLPILHNDLIKYNNEYFKVIGKPMTDSHTKLYCKHV